MSTSSVAHDRDLGAIEAAVKETARGRAFLADYARKVRQSDTLTMLALIGRLERWSQDQDVRLAELEGRNRVFGNQRPEVHAGRAVGLCGPSTEQMIGRQEVSLRSNFLDILTVTASDQDSASVGCTSDDAAGGIVSVRQNREAIDRIEDLADAFRDLERRITDLTSRYSTTRQFTDNGQSAPIASVDDGMGVTISHSVASATLERFSPDTAHKTHPMEEDVLDGIAKALGTGV